MLMGCDYFLDEEGRFEIEFRYELSNGAFVTRPIIIDGKPKGRIYMEVLKGEGRGIHK